MSAREARIAAAIQRSKEEYRPVHAYTERDEARESEDKHGLEHTVTRLYLTGNDQAVIDAATSSFVEGRPLGNLSREVVDTAMRSCLRSHQDGLLLARSTRSLWRGPSAGIVAVVADCFLQQRLYREALEPLLVSLSQSLHTATLERLSRVLLELGEEDFRADVEGYLAKQTGRRKDYPVHLGLEGDLLEAQESAIKRLHKDTQDTIRSVREL